MREIFLPVSQEFEKSYILVATVNQVQWCPLSYLVCLFISCALFLPLCHTKIWEAISLLQMALKNINWRGQSASYIYYLVQQLAFFNLKILETKNGIWEIKVMKKVRNAGLSWKRSRNVGSGPPPLLDPVTSMAQASSYLSVCQPNSQGLNPYRKTGLILGSWRWF